MTITPLPNQPEEELIPIEIYNGDFTVYSEPEYEAFMVGLCEGWVSIMDSAHCAKVDEQLRKHWSRRVDSP